jgi:hypothetical protein
VSFFRVEPEVAGGLGPNTEMDRSRRPPRIHKLHCVFDGWLGDDLVESFPAFVITSDALRRLQEAQLTGFEDGDVEIGRSEQFDELYPDRQLPEFRRLGVTGKARVDDFGTDDDGVLVVSDRVLGVLRQGSLDNAEVEDA